MHTDDLKPEKTNKESSFEGLTFFDGSIFAEGRGQSLLAGLEAQTADEQFTLVRHVQCSWKTNKGKNSV